MTARDLAWRGLGLGLVAAACAIRVAEGTDGRSLAGLIGFMLVITGLVLVVQGKRVPAALRVERSQHRLLAHNIRNRRRSRTRDDER